MAQSYPQPPVPTTVRRPWLRIFWVGLVLWLATVVVVFATGNPVLVPTLVLLGSFLVPVTFVVWAFQRRETGELTPGLILSTFLAGGVLGVLASSLLESYLLRPSWWLFFGVGLIEEAVKLGVLAFLTRHLHHKAVRDGIILGASVGFGFAALETAGYAFTALFTAHGLSVTQLVQTELLRSVISPFGHGLWTAILGGVLFSSSTREHFVITGRLILAYLGVSLLHAFWDGSRVIALLLTLLFTGAEVSNGRLVRPTSGQVALFTALQWIGLAIVAIIGLLWLWALVRKARRAPHPPPPQYGGWRVPIRPPGT
ncbi:PrsW family intramembrane metalloprotease [Micromonospora narathiwatensis]|uniref:Membrane proteinase PrsW, cleaves anti-sigma factor RsiW, M82 family n=1 Tax=Micromonospora narathiwatensis TaxID=299146 RepID=A0A1A9AFC1_9ACTN|nr:PrsW family glutamic-type intramembrane protease [Micromonospora narathiwatensis]SBT54886.1 Membrane proteinase PrsW, cleaves anti-sigma factor RsiW, M82 family [Micromonospora narathiwatensis]